MSAKLRRECRTTMNQEDKIIKNKLGVLRLAVMLGNVSQPAR
jgi:hypothetical protein